MEEHKKRYLRDYLRDARKDLDYYVNIIKVKEEELRSCYAESIAFKSDEFVRIVLVDAVFIIKTLLSSFPSTCRNPHDHICCRSWMMNDIRPDLLLLENQLPLVILEDLFNPVRKYFSHEQISIAGLAHVFFNRMISVFEEHLERSSPRAKHFVDLLSKFSAFPLRPKSETERQLETSYLPSATKLHQAGVKFKARTSKNLLDIQFSKGILEIPKLMVTDHTEILIRNLVAFEQCHFSDNRYITDYVVLLDNLVNTPEDVDLLVKSAIIDNQLGDSNQVANLINKLGDGVAWSTDDYYFAETSEELCKYYGKPWHKWKANLKQNYFHSPWAGLSVIAAVFIIILTFIQTVCSIISTVKGYSL
ncbi:UPF0481 protein At3g47200-like isoform X2 [Humulus lupulus]|nr:UPF0481 protein At3g47200-like isoform X2 [Humulus lupulus]